MPVFDVEEEQNICSKRQVNGDTDTDRVLVLLQRQDQQTDERSRCPEGEYGEGEERRGF